MAVHLCDFHTRKAVVLRPLDFADLQELVATEPATRCAKADQIFMDSNGKRVVDITGPCGASEDSPIFLFHRTALISTRPWPPTRLLCERFVPQKLLRTGYAVADVQSHMEAIQRYTLGMQQYDRCAHIILHAAAMQRASLRGLIASLQSHLDRIVQDYDAFSKHLRSLRESDAVLAQSADTVLSLLQQLPAPLHPTTPSPTTPTTPTVSAIATVPASSRFDDVFAAALERFRVLLQSFEERTPGYKSAVDAVRDAVAAIDRSVLEAVDLGQGDFAKLRQDQLGLIKIVQTQCERASLANWDPNILAQYIPHHVEIGVTLLVAEDHSWDILCQMEQRGQSYATRAMLAMQRVCVAQLKIKACQRYDYQGQTTEAAALCSQLLAAVRLPHAAARLRPEIERRREFRRHYDAACATAFAKLSRLRQVELARRRQFFVEHGKALQQWFALPGLDDYPHSCIMTARPFDMALPDVPADINDHYQAIWHAASQLPLYKQAQPTWQCCQPEPAPEYPWAERAQQTDLDSRAGRSDSLPSSAAAAAPTPAAAASGGPAGASAGVGVGTGGNTGLATVGVQAASASAVAGFGAAPAGSSVGTGDTASGTDTAIVAALEEQIAMLNVECELYRRHCQRLVEERARVSDQMQRVVSEMEQERKRLQLQISERSAVGSITAESLLPRTVAVEQFKIGDLALLCPWKGHKDRIAFNIGAPYRILPFERLRGLAVQSAAPFLGRITAIEERRALENDPFGVPVNTVYYLLDCIAAVPPRPDRGPSQP